MQEKCERKKRCGQESFAFDRKQISENYLGIYRQCWMLHFKK